MKALVSAIRTLSLVPVPGTDTDRFEASLPWFPLVGAGLGLTGAGVLLSVRWTGPDVAAALTVSVLAVLTGGLHLDGLADSADGFGCRGDRERILRVMKDPSVGAFGVIALILLLLTKWTAVSSLASSGGGNWLVVACVVSRAMLSVQCATQPYARIEGTAAGIVHGARPRHAMLAMALATALAWSAAGMAAVAALALAVSVTFGLGYWSRRRIGGITGDVLGATCELLETGVLLGASTWMQALT